MFTKKAVVLLGCLHLTAGVLPLWGGPIKTLVMSGKLIQKHAKYEGTCDKCHRPFSEATQEELCLDCHRNISGDLKNGKGFHGREKSIQARRCKHCHTDHKGREADIIRFDGEVFDHKSTDFPLKGRHKGVDCGKCHKENEKYSKAPAFCADCHDKDGPHQGNLGKKCADCHSETGWSKTEFNHQKTGFPLDGKHKKLSCTLCHPYKRFNEKTSSRCQVCHIVNDVHSGKYGNVCKKCHNSASWEKTLFSHEKFKFPLRGQHKKVECFGCHKGNRYKNLGTSCFSCHGGDDEHNGVYGQNCERCHDEKKGWPQYLFNHSKTSFPLLDRHKKVRCASCHRKPFDLGDATTCFGCHKRNDVHGEKFGKKCEPCHTVQNSWADHIFDHGKTGFRLRGAHQKLPCSVCHEKIVSRQEPRAGCIDCHRGDDIHKNNESAFCEECHNERDWNKKVFFDHDFTSFPLVGIHAVTPCEECHFDSRYREVTPDCYQCHRTSDVHENRLGRNCRTCHTPNSWKLWTFNHTTRTKFVLEGQHENLKCRLCHTKVFDKNFTLSQLCVDCHEKDDEHRGDFGKACKTCHTTNSFKDFTVLL